MKYDLSRLVHIEKGETKLQQQQQQQQQQQLSFER